MNNSMCPHKFASLNCKFYLRSNFRRVLCFLPLHTNKSSMQLISLTNAHALVYLGLTTFGFLRAPSSWFLASRRLSRRDKRFSLSRRERPLLAGQSIEWPLNQKLSCLCLFIERLTTFSVLQVKVRRQVQVFSKRKTVLAQDYHLLCP